MKKFPLGSLYITPAAIDFLTRNGISSSRLIDRHVSGDWGDLCEEDVLENEQSLDQGFRLFSSYKFGEEAVWCITEADRSATTLLRPDDY